MDGRARARADDRELAPTLRKPRRALSRPGTSFPSARGALKLKETLYPPEGYAAGELKAWSIALIDETMP